MEYSALQQKGFEIAKFYSAALTVAERIEIIARTFGCKAGNVSTHPCTGTWRGQSDIYLNLDNGSSLWIGTRQTPRAKTAKTINGCVGSALARYNPKIVDDAKESAATALLRRETEDNAIAAQMGLKTYTFLTVELNNGAGMDSSGYLGWYYVTLAVEDNVFAFLESGLNGDIARGTLSERVSRPNYCAAGGLRDTEANFVFNNIGHSSFNGSYQLPLPNDVRARAEQTLNGRILSDSSGVLANRHPYWARKLKRALNPSERKEPIKAEKETLLGELAEAKATVAERGSGGERAAARPSLAEAR